MTGRLASKVVVVTGGGTGIGRAVAGLAVAEGATVVIGGRRRAGDRRGRHGLTASGYPRAWRPPRGGKLCPAAPADRPVAAAPPPV